jgi:YfiH family protein
MGAGLERLRLVRQVHGIDIAIASGRAGAMVDQQEADIIISGDPDLAIGVRVADCAPVLIADRRLGSVGAAHAGWRGTTKRAAVVLANAMEHTFGSRRDDLVAAIGPCLGPCCGEVGPEVVRTFREAGHTADDVARWFAPGASGRPYLNLWGANRDQLESAGIPPSQIHVAEICTKTHAALLHSYRAQGPKVGRMVAVIRASGGR